jgi:hypothetical protein
MKFLDPDKPSWQNGSALEVIHKIVVRCKHGLLATKLLHNYLCTSYNYMYNN